jgi:hypothetical protein
MPEVASPGSPNLSSDSRACGLGLRKLSLRSIEGNGWRSILQRKLVTLKTGRCEFKVTEEVPTAGPDTTIL